MPGQVVLKGQLKDISKIKIKEVTEPLTIKAAYVLVNGQKQLWFVKDSG